VPITPEAPARLVSPDGNVIISLDANSVDVPSQLTYVPLSVAEIPALPPDFTATGKAFDLTLNAALLRPITITVALSAADATLAGGDKDNIVIQHHRNGTWVPLDTTVDFGASAATAQVENLSILALTIRRTVPTATPPPIGTTVTPVPTVTPPPVLTQTPTRVPTATSNPTVVPTVTAIPTGTPTVVPLPPTANPTSPPTPTPTATPTPIFTPTPRPTIPPIQALNALDYFFIGSTKDEVLAVQGTPTGISVRISGDVWSYGRSQVNFDTNDKVVGWADSSGILKLR